MVYSGYTARHEDFMSTATEHALITRWITPNRHKPGPADAWVLPAHVSVWAVIRQLELEAGDPVGVSAVYDLPLEAIAAARVYYQQHRCAIDAHIRQNRRSFGV